MQELSVYHVSGRHGHRIRGILIVGSHGEHYEGELAECFQCGCKAYCLVGLNQFSCTSTIPGRGLQCVNCGAIYRLTSDD